MIIEMWISSTGKKKSVEWDETLRQYMVFEDTGTEIAYCGLYDTIADAEFWERDAEDITVTFPDNGA